MRFCNKGEIFVQKYYTVTKDNGIFEKYIQDRDGDMALISFYDEDFSDIYCLLKKSCEAEQTFDEAMLKAVFFEFVGEDNYLYRMNYETGEINKVFKWPLKRLIKQFKNYKKTIQEVETCRSYISSNYEKDTIIKQNSLIPNYEKYKFVDRDNLIEIPFRFKKSSKNEKMPLVIYFHGAGALGKDNIRQFLEYKGLSWGFSKKNCHVLVPQMTKGVGENISIITTYCKSIKKLIEKLLEIAQIDFDRIYIVGASLGGACVWYSLYEFPGFYAAGIPLMGYFPTYNSTKFDIKSFKNENIWIGHSQNDNAVAIKDDQTMYKLLKSAGYNVKMTTYNKYGHGMSGIFVRKEKWKKWLFEQKKQNNHT